MDPIFGLIKGLHVHITEQSEDCYFTLQLLETLHFNTLMKLATLLLKKYVRLTIDQSPHSSAQLLHKLLMHTSLHQQPVGADTCLPPRGT